MNFSSITLVLLIPALAVPLLVALHDYRLSARVNVLASLLTFLAALSLFRWRGAPTPYFLVDDLNPTGYPQVVDELKGAGAVTRTYTHGLQRIDENQDVNGPWTPSFYGYDGGGNVRNPTNSGRLQTRTFLVQFRAHRGLRESHIGGHIGCFYNV